MMTNDLEQLKARVEAAGGKMWKADGRSGWVISINGTGHNFIGGVRDFAFWNTYLDGLSMVRGPVVEIGDECFTCGLNCQICPHSYSKNPGMIAQIYYQSETCPKPAPPGKVWRMYLCDEEEL